MQAKHEPFAPVNYKLLAQSIKNRHRHEQDHIKMLQQGTGSVILSSSCLVFIFQNSVDNVWAAGTGNRAISCDIDIVFLFNLEDGILHRMGAEKGLISTRTHSYSQKPHFNSNKGNDIREKVKVNSYPIF